MRSIPIHVTNSGYVYDDSSDAAKINAGRKMSFKLVFHNKPVSVTFNTNILRNWLYALEHFDKTNHTCWNTFRNHKSNSMLSRTIKKSFRMYNSQTSN